MAAAPSCAPTSTSTAGSPAPHPRQRLLSECLPSGSSKRRAEVSHSCFTLHFLLTGDVEHLSYAFCANSIGSLVRCLFSSFAYFKRRLFSYHSILRILCIFHITVLYHLCLLQTFSPSPYFAEQKFLILTQSSLSIVSFMTCAFNVVPKKSLPNPKSTGFSPLLPSRSQFCFTFRSVTHLELLSMKGVRSMSRFTFLCVDVQVFQQCLLRDHLASLH